VKNSEIESKTAAGNVLEVFLRGYFLC
jgi:hypothetical protein